MQTQQEWITPAANLETLRVRAAALAVDVTADPHATTARLMLSGPQEAVHAARVERDGAVWRLSLPSSGPAAVAGGGTVITAGTISGSVVISGGTVTIDGVPVTGEARTEPAGPVRAEVALPAATAIEADLQAGTLHAHGTAVGRIRARGTALDVLVEAAVALEARTSSGDIEATASGPITATSASGDVLLTATSDQPIHAQTSSGDIHIHRGDHQPPIQARAASGSVEIT